VDIRLSGELGAAEVLEAMDMGSVVEDGAPKPTVFVKVVVVP